MNESDIIVAGCFTVIAILVVVIILVMAHYWRSLHQLRKELDNSREIIRYNKMAYNSLQKTCEQLRQKLTEDSTPKDS